MNTIIGVESWAAVWIPIAGIRGARPARDERDSRPPGQLPVSLRHVGDAALLAADDETEPVPDVVERIEHGEIALARYAKGMGRALCNQVVDKNRAAGSFVAQGVLPCRGRSMGARQAALIL
jgi:hypothetical protein